MRVVSTRANALTAQAQEKDATDSNEEEENWGSDSDSKGSTASEEPATKRLKTVP